MAILITGANGQLGTVLSHKLSELHGSENVLRTDITESNDDHTPFEYFNVLDKDALIWLIEEYKIEQIYHLAAILSANGEKQPHVTWKVNLQSYLTMLDVASQKGIQKIFFPSTIAVFGPTTPLELTPQDSPLLPTTVYGISKVTGELWNQYFWDNYNLDVRSVRYPGIIGHQSLPGGGTTDYAVEIFHEALKTGHYTCYLAPDRRLPMMYMDDAVRATIELMQSPSDRIGLHYGYNISGLNFTPAELASEIQKHIPNFTIDYKPDYRDEIAASWPSSIDDSIASREWNWKSQYDLPKMTSEMLENLKIKYNL